MSFPLKLSNPKSLIVTGKFCLPSPTVVRGTFEATLQTQPTDGDITQSSGIATATFVDPHGLKSGDIVRVYGCSVEDYNGKKKIVVVDPYTITYSVSSSATTPSGGTPFVTKDIMVATGTNTFAGLDFVSGDWMYVPALNELRQIAEANPQNPTRWILVSPFSQDISAGELIQIVPKGVYKGIAVKNIGEADGIYKEVDLTVSDLTESNFDQACLEPVCGDATGTTFKINLQ